MKIAGKIDNSFVDYPGNIAAAVFAAGCNLNCYYCHNRSIISAKDCTVLYSPALILKEIAAKKGFIDAVAVSGGEPTLQAALPDFLRAVKSEGLLAKLDTNGTRPDVIQDLLREGLLDYIAMDVKAPPEKYGRITLSGVDIEAIKRSIGIIKSGRVAYEFRTTFAPDLTAEDIESIARDLIPGARLYTVNQYRAPEYDPRFLDKRLNAKPHSADAERDAAGRAGKHVEECVARGI